MNYLTKEVFHKKHVIAGFGNPLVDISAVLKTSDFLDKFNLKPDTQYEVNEDDIHKILESLKSDGHEVRKSPGGCALNTLRIVQDLVKQPDFCVYFGGLGTDKDGAFIESEVKKYGIKTRYAKHSAYSTGKVAALINGDNRSLVAHIGAAERYRLEDLETTENLKLLEDVMLVYIEGFFITHSLDVALKAIKMCKSNGAVIAFNISGAYVADVCADKLLATVTVADIIIGNDAELKALGRVAGLKFGSVEDLALNTYSFLCEKNPSSLNYKLKHMNSLGKVLIITQGKGSIFCVYGDKKFVDFNVPPLDSKLIRDTTGAGDSFAAAFLVAVIQGKPMTECLEYGCAVAQKVIQQIGVSIPSE